MKHRVSALIILTIGIVTSAKSVFGESIGSISPFITNLKSSLTLDSEIQ